MNTTYRIDKEKLLRTIERDGMKPAEFYYELLEVTAVGIIVHMIWAAMDAI